MKLSDYKWPRNPRGLHNSGVLLPFDSNRYTRPQMGWAKLVVGGNEMVDVAGEMLEQGCMSIIRIFRENMGAIRAPEVWYRNYQEYIDAGVLWFEFYNEPNLEGEWPQNGDNTGPTIFVSYENEEEVIEPMMDNWIDWAERIIDMGGYPGFPALADTPDGRHATIYWLNAFLRYLKRNHERRFRTIINNGLWCATHPYLQNHFYQASAGGPAYRARPFAQQNANEGGWHFEYPYDPLQQRDDPGRTAFGGTALSPNGDTNGLIAAGQVFQELLLSYFGAGPVPVVGTEGGIWRVPLPDDEPHLIDTRYPAYDYNSFTEATMALWKWIANQGPPWMFGVTLWMELDYYDIQGTLPVIDRMAREAPELKDVPSIDTNSGKIGWYAVPLGDEDDEEEAEDDDEVEAAPNIGPAPVTGSSVDFHWLVLAPGLQADWFFRAGRRYWQNFRPTVLTDWSLISRIPNNRTLAITVLARNDTIDFVNEEIRDRWPNIKYDPIVFDSLDDMQRELDDRANFQRRFGDE